MRNSVLLVLLVFITLGGKLNAQQFGSEAKRDKTEMLEKMKERLSLSDQQVTQIKAIDAKYLKQQQESKDKMTKLREEHQALRDQKKAEIDQVLTADQRQKMTDWRNDNRQGRNKDSRKGDNKKNGKGIRR